MIKQPLKKIPVNSGNYGQYVKGGYIQIGKTVIVDAYVAVSQTATTGKPLLSSFPDGGLDNSSTLIALLQNLSSPTVAICRIFADKIYPNDSFEAGDYHIFGTYQAV